jgi:hypothetical protein
MTLAVKVSNVVDKVEEHHGSIGTRRNRTDGIVVL